MREQAGFHFQGVGQADLLGHYLHAHAHLSVRLKARAPKTERPVGSGNLEVLEDGEVLEIEGVWKLAADAAAHADVLVQPGEFLVPEFMLPLLALVLPQIRSSSVVLPAPLGPMITRSSFLSI